MAATPLPLRTPKTASGIAIDPQTLERIVPVTKRKDGTVRKEIKIRPGFTPEEDVARYKTTSAKDQARLKGFVPGATSSSSATYVLDSESDFPGLDSPLSKNAKKHAARKRRKDEEKEAELNNAKEWDEESGDEKTTAAVVDKPIDERMDGLSLNAEPTKKEEEQGPKVRASLQRPPRKNGLLDFKRDLGGDSTPASASPSSESIPIIPLAPPIETPISIATTDKTPASSQTPSDPSPSSIPPKPKSKTIATPYKPPSTPSTPASTLKTPQKKSIPGTSSNPSSTTKPGEKKSEPRTRPEVRVRPGHSAMAQVMGVLGGQSGRRQ